MQHHMIWFSVNGFHKLGLDWVGVAGLIHSCSSPSEDTSNGGSIFVWPYLFGQDFFISWFTGFFFFRFRVGGWKKKIKKLWKWPVNWSFSELFIYLLFSLITPENSKTSEVNQQSVLNLYIFHHFPLDRTIIFNSVTLKNTQTEPQKKNFQLNK